MWIVSERHDGNTSITPFKDNEEDKAQKLLDKIINAGGTAILLEIGVSARIKQRTESLKRFTKAARLLGVSLEEANIALRQASNNIKDTQNIKRG